MEISGTSKSNFKLVKWFFDCVDDDGNCFIIYSADLYWKRWKISFASVLNLDYLNHLSYVSKLRNIKMPVQIENHITWKDDFFKLKGTWEAQEEAIQAKLFENKSGSLIWNCIQPKAKVKLCTPDKTYTGLGYVEKLTLTTVPWEIPMNELRWGRFVSSKHYIVWIEYKQNETKQWVWLNGELTPHWEISDDYLCHDERKIRLLFNEKFVLEKEKKLLNVFKGIFKFLPGFNKIIPRPFLYADERKWLSNSSLEIGGEIVGTGWTIHELVNFNED